MQVEPEACQLDSFALTINQETVPVVSSHWKYYADEACLAPYCRPYEDIDWACDCPRIPGNSFDVHRLTFVLAKGSSQWQLSILVHYPHPDLFGHEVRPGVYKLTEDWDRAVEDQRQQMENTLAKYGFRGIKKAPLVPLIEVNLLVMTNSTERKEGTDGPPTPPCQEGWPSRT